MKVSNLNLQEGLVTAIATMFLLKLAHWQMCTSVCLRLRYRHRWTPVSCDIKQHGFCGCNRSGYTNSLSHWDMLNSDHWDLYQLQKKCWTNGMIGFLDKMENIDNRTIWKRPSIELCTEITQFCTNNLKRSRLICIIMSVSPDN